VKRAEPPLRSVEPALVELHFGYRRAARRARVFIPAAVEPEAPLLLLFDGQNVFGDEGSYAGGWYAHRAVDALPRTVRRPVVVGIDNGGIYRNRELWSGLDELLGAIASSLLPAIRARWSIGAGPVVLGGASMGGLAALAGHLRHPRVFGGVLGVSPSFWVGGGALFGEVAGTIPHGRPRIYIDAGQREKGQMFEQAAQMAALLVRRGYPASHVRWRPDRRGTHHERHWRRRLPGALRFLFHKRVPVEEGCTWRDGPPDGVKP
jgi:predicted alpha/beta superfamily hydrolase